MHPVIEKALATSFGFLVEDKGFEFTDLVASGYLTSPELIVKFENDREAFAVFVAPAWAPDARCGLLLALQFLKESAGESTDDLPASGMELGKLGRKFEENFDRVIALFAHDSGYDARRARLSEYAGRKFDEMVRRVRRQGGPDVLPTRNTFD